MGTYANIGTAGFKRNFVLMLLLMMISASVKAQTQQGLVKTRGRMVNGLLQPGVGLSGVTVTLNDRSVVSNGAKGVFSFPVQGGNYYVRNVTKEGYQLVDQEVCRSYRYSSDPLSKSLKIIEATLGYRDNRYARICKDIADTYNELGLSGESLSYFQQAVDIYKRNNNKSALVSIYDDMADICYDNDDYDAALKYYQCELQLQIDSVGEQTDDVARTYRWMGHTSYRAEYFEQALAYYHKSYDIRKTVLPSGHVNTAIVCKDLADTYRKLKNHVKSVEYYQEAGKLYQLVEQPDEDDMEKIKEISERLISESLLAGNECVERKDYVLGVKYYSLALDSILLKGDKTDMVICSIGLGNAYLGTGDYRKNRKEIFGLFEKSIYLCIKIGSIAYEISSRHTGLQDHP